MMIQYKFLPGSSQIICEKAYEINTAYVFFFFFFFPNLYYEYQRKSFFFLLLNFEQSSRQSIVFVESNIHAFNVNDLWLENITDLLVFRKSLGTCKEFV